MQKRTKGEKEIEKEAPTIMEIQREKEKGRIRERDNE